MKKKKIIKVAVIFLMGAVLFLTINKYMLNKDNKKENFDNNEVADSMEESFNYLRNREFP